MDTPKKLALKDIITRYPKDTPILEVGFGDGDFLKALQDAGYTNLTGTEISDSCIKSARKRLGTNIQYYLTSSPGFIRYESEPEVVCCFEVIEHLQKPEKLIKILPGRVLYLSTPNPNRWLPVLTKKWFGRPRFETWDFPPNHLHRFTRPMLVSILSSGGYLSKINITEPGVQTQTILRSLIPRGPNSEDYDDMRPKHPWLTKNIRRVFTPITFLMMLWLNLNRHKGISYYVRAER